VRGRFTTFLPPGASRNPLFCPKPFGGPRLNKFQGPVEMFSSVFQTRESCPLTFKGIGFDGFQSFGGSVNCTRFVPAIFLKNTLVGCPWVALLGARKIWGFERTFAKVRSTNSFWTLVIGCSSFPAGSLARDFPCVLGGPQRGLFSHCLVPHLSVAHGGS